MKFNKKTILDIDLVGKTVLLRVDYNIPLLNGVITSDYRIKRSMETINYLRSQKCKIVICSHLGRPSGPDDDKYSLKPVAVRLAQMLDTEVAFAEDCISEESKKQILNLNESEILLLENLRFYKQEEENDLVFAKRLSENSDLFVQDAFGAVHRQHASTSAITNFLPSVAGLLLEREVSTINRVMSQPKRPLMGIIGGAKINDKIAMINRLIDTADIVAIGGAMSNAFLAAEGNPIGGSLIDPSNISVARKILTKARAKEKNENFIFYLPEDGVASTEMNNRRPIKIIKHSKQNIALNADKIADNEMLLDIGPLSGAYMAKCIMRSQTVIWNGTMGVTEIKGLNNADTGPFSYGTKCVYEAMMRLSATGGHSIVCGGDTAGYLEGHNIIDCFNHVSTGGGASIELMGGRNLPGLNKLLDTVKSNKPEAILAA